MIVNKFFVEWIKIVGIFDTEQDIMYYYDEEKDEWYETED